MPQPRKEIDLETLAKVSTLSPTLEELAAVFDVSLSTINRRVRDDEEFRAIVERGRGLGKMRLRTRLRDSDNPSVLIFRAKNELGYRDFKAVEISGADGGPVEVTWLQLARSQRASADS